MATQLCDGGHVRVNGNPAKPSTKVRAGDVAHALIAERERIVEVVRPIETRVGAPVAATCYIDNSPALVVREIAPGIMAVRGQGRPSKQLRRKLERMLRDGRG
jgi:ribosome-associated heat shock protein Hsp15